MEKRQLEETLNKITKNCELCKAKVCNICPNGKTKKLINLKLNPNLNSKLTYIEKIKNFFNIKF